MPKPVATPEPVPDVRGALQHAADSADAARTGAEKCGAAQLARGNANRRVLIRDAQSFYRQAFEMIERSLAALEGEFPT